MVTDVLVDVCYPRGWTISNLKECLEDTVALSVVHEQGFPFWFLFDLPLSTAPWL